MRRLALALGLHAALVVWLTWPLAAHVRTRFLNPLPLIARTDTLSTMWALAWETHALATAPTALANANIYHPTPNALFYGITAFGALPSFAPAFALTANPIFALNVTLFACFILTAVAIHRIVVCWTGSELAGAIAGIAFLLDRWVLWMIPVMASYASLQYLPLVIFGAAMPTIGTRTGLWLAVAIVLACLTDPMYVAPSVLLPLVLIVVTRLIRPSRRGEGVRLAVVVTIAVLGLAPVGGGYLAVRFANPALAAQSLWQSSSAMPGEFPLRLPRDLFAAFTALPNAGLALVPLAAVAIAVRAARGYRWETRREWQHAIFWVVVGLVLSMTPTVFWGGHEIHLPHYALAMRFPVYRFIRVPARLRLGAMTGLALLVGLAFAECVRVCDAVRAGQLRALAKGTLTLAVAAAMYAEYRSGGAHPAFPRIPPTHPLGRLPPLAGAVVETLRAGTGPVLEVPAGVEGAPNVQAMYRSIGHWRPLVNGYGSYWPAAFPERMALAERLPDPVALAALRAETGLTTVVVNLESDFSQRGAWRALADAGGNDGLRLVARSMEQLVFAVGGTATEAAAQ